MDSRDNWSAIALAALPTPMGMDGEVDEKAFGHLVQSIGEFGIGGVAVGTPLGRGTRLSPDAWKRLLTAGRENLIEGKRYLASAGGPSTIRNPSEMNEAARSMALAAAGAGVDVLIAEPPAAVRGRPERDRLILEYHSAIAEAERPIMIAYRREISGGIAYSPEVLAQLLARPEVLGVQIATIDGIVIFQQVEALARELAPSKIVVSGEERFLGYSLLCGADAAIVGLAALEPERVARLMEAHGSGDAAGFLKRTQELDRIARPIFRSPSEGIPLRMLRALSEKGVISSEAAHDPWA